MAKKTTAGTAGSRARRRRPTPRKAQGPVRRKLGDSLHVRLWISIAVGVAVGVGTLWMGHSPGSLMLGWVVAATLFTVSTWYLVFRMSDDDTRDHAQENNPSAGVSDTLLMSACMASIVGLALLMFGAKSKGQLVPDSIIGVLGILASWSAIHTLFTLRYAYVYFRDDGTGINFNGDDHPCYIDFAYLAFTIGMTYQVSDTNLGTKELRRIALHHALISYLFGTVVVASMINMFVQVASGG